MNGYISIEIGGKKRGLKFAMYSVGMIGRRAGKFLNDELMTTQVAVEIFYAGLVNNCLVKEIDQDFTYEEVTDWVEEMWFDDEGQKKIADVVKTFTESKPVLNGQKLSESIDEDTKKKNTGSDWDQAESFAFGELGLLPSQYYGLTWREFELMCRGYRNKMRGLEALLRKHAIFSLSAHPHIKIDAAYDAWRLEGEEKKQKASSNLLRFLKEYKARDIIQRKAEDYKKIQKRLNGGRTEDKDRG